MPFIPPRARRLRFRPAALLAAAVAVALSCSSDPDGPVGSDPDLLGSRPGDVFQDTIAVYADTVLAYHSVIAAGTTMEFGRADGYTRAMIIDFNFSEVAGDTARIVTGADLRLVPDDIDGSFPARFYQMTKRYAEGDSVPSLDTLAVITDPLSGSVERTLQPSTTLYDLPPALVQSWVSDSDSRTAIVIIYTDDVNDRIATFNTREATGNRPRLRVLFQGGEERLLFARADAVFVRPTGTTPHRIISDGFVRRTYFRVRLDELVAESAVHTARVRFHIVPGSVLGTSNAVIYVPNSADPASRDFRGGQLVTNVAIADGDESVEFPLTNSIFLTLQGTIPDNGFVLRLASENASVRQIEFYGSTAPDSLRPRVYITSSTPAVFDP